MKTSIGIDDKNTLKVATELSRLLADEYVLYTKTRKAHWNIEGPDFYDKHKFFEAQSEKLDEFIDAVAERIRSLGHYAPGTLSSYLALTHLSESTRETNSSAGFIKELLMDHEAIIITLRGHIHAFGDEFRDAGTSDFITGIMKEHEKMAWFLRAHL
jgi:starvation-inducible DNA-binding protein